MKKSKFMVIALIWLLLASGLVLVSCSTTKQWGLEGSDTIALNLTKDPNAGDLYITHINGIATGGAVKKVYINPIYIKLDGNPIIFTIRTPVASRNLYGQQVISYKSTELRLTKLADIKAGDVLTLRWMYQTQTFAFLDATGNIVQQSIPTFN
jgi:hypothetical protein